MNSYYVESAREIPVIADVDVLVVGAGPAGVSAAICAARNGARTMLIEQTGDVGGVATTGLMSHWAGNTQGGFYEELLRASADGEDRQVINTEKLKTCLLEMLVREQVRVQLYTFASSCMMDGMTIRGVVTESKSGREAIAAKIVIDATGDGDIAANAGVPYRKGREEDGKMQPLTLMFKVGGVDIRRGVFPGSFEDNWPVPLGRIQTIAKERLPFPAGHVLLYRSSLPGVVTCNMTNCIDADGTDVRDLTKATLVCRQQIEPIVKFLRECVPGFEDCYVLHAASVIGVRETRHFYGEKTLTEQDINEARVFEDWAVTKASFNFDVHNITGSGLDKTGKQKEFRQAKGYTIPYGCFVPLKVENLLLAGRNISGTHMASSNYRVMPICANMGQAAGSAAALCVREGVAPRKLEVAKLQRLLAEQGVLPE